MQIFCGKRCYFLFGCDELTLMRKPSDRGQLEAEAASCRPQVQHDKKVEIASAKTSGKTRGIRGGVDRKGYLLELAWRWYRGPAVEWTFE